MNGYNIDVVMCIDATGSMKPFMSEVKANVLSFYRKFVEEMEAMGYSVDQLRIKVIAFRDYGCDSEPMVESKFFTLDDESTEFHDFVSRIEAKGGRAGGQNALEALALAMKSDWVRTDTRRRHVIMLWTDGDALELGVRRNRPLYPFDMPRTLEELKNEWDEKMDRRAKRLILFAPDVWPWSDIIDWDGIFHQVSQAGKGCSDTDIDCAIRLIAPNDL